MADVKEEENVRKTLMEGYFKALDTIRSKPFPEMKDVGRFMAIFSEKLKTYRGISGDPVDSSLEAYRTRQLVHWQPEQKRTGFKHNVLRLDVKVAGNQATATAELNVTWEESGKTTGGRRWFDVFRLEKERRIWKITELRWIPYGGDLAIRKYGT